MSQAIAKVNYKKGNVTYESESFMSEKYNTYVYKMSTLEKTPFSCRVTMERKQDAYTSALNDDTLVLNGIITYKDGEMYGKGDEGMCFSGLLKVVTDGKTASDKKSISVVNATYIIIFATFSLCKIYFTSFT